MTKHDRILYAVVFVLSIILTVSVAASAVLYLSIPEPTHAFSCRYFGDTGYPVCDLWEVLPNQAYQDLWEVECFYFEDSPQAVCWTPDRIEAYQNGTAPDGRNYVRPDGTE